MLAYSPAKINIGLRILNKREDGFHNIHSYFYPVPLYDLIEIQRSNKDELYQTGFISTTDMESNLVYKAVVLLRTHLDIPALKIHLHKQIPFQAGLGGGSANAITFIKLILRTFKFSLSQDQWKEISEKLGSDCPFFIQSLPSEVKGRGEIVNVLNWTLKGTKIMIVKPDLVINTSEAFQDIEWKDQLLEDIRDCSLGQYQEHFPNQFEKKWDNKHPILGEIKEKLIRSGAFYASLSGSGSAVFGLFKNAATVTFPSSYFTWHGELQ